MAILEINKFECAVLRNTLLASVVLSPLRAGALIRRHGFGVLVNSVRDGRCPDCGTPIAGVGMGSERYKQTEGAK
ncbi:MAG: hypothetical protein J7M27_06435 [Candidatus Latescibacteria bacterium]|nr:hypothetical protein [Candidatus Latescibacterota bacterium]